MANQTVTDYSKGQYHFGVQIRKQSSEGSERITGGRFGRVVADGSTGTVTIVGHLNIDSQACHRIASLHLTPQAARKLRRQLSQAIKQAEQETKRKQEARRARLATPDRKPANSNGIWVIDEAEIRTRKARPAAVGTVRFDPAAFERAKAKAREQEAEAARKAAPWKPFDVSGSKAKQAELQEEIMRLKMDRESAAFKATMSGSRSKAAVSRTARLMGTVTKGSQPSDSVYYIN
jgi:hypothetical protein